MYKIALSVKRISQWYIIQYSSQVYKQHLYLEYNLSRLLSSLHCYRITIENVFCFTFTVPYAVLSTNEIGLKDTYAELFHFENSAVSSSLNEGI